MYYYELFCVVVSHTHTDTHIINGTVHIPIDDEAYKILKKEQETFSSN